MSSLAAVGTGGYDWDPLDENAAPLLQAATLLGQLSVEIHHEVGRAMGGGTAEVDVVRLSRVVDKIEALVDRHLLAHLDDEEAGS